MICDLPWVILPTTWTLPNFCSAAMARMTHLSAFVAPGGNVVVVDAAVLRWFQQSGPGYQSRIGAALKSHMTRRKAAAKTSRGKAVARKKAG